MFSTEPKTLDPQIASDSNELIVVEALYEGLVRLDSNNNPYPGVAEKWESNADQTVFTFHLRADAKWSDNKTPVTAKDFVFAFRRALEPATGSKTCSPLFCIKNAKEINTGKAASDQLGVTAQDDHTLVVQLNYSNSSFPLLTASSVFMPCNEAFFTGTSGRYGLDYKYLLGNGPFRLDGKYGWDHGKYINLVRSGTYKGDKIPLPASLKLTIQTSSGNSASSGTSSAESKIDPVSDPIAALKAGVVDAVSISSAKAAQAAEAGCTLTSFDNTTWGLCFNTQSDFMKNTKVRTAFLQALNRPNVLKHLPKGVSPAESIIPPSIMYEGNHYLSLAGNSPSYLKQNQNAAGTLAAGLSELSGAQLKNISVLCPDDANMKLMLNEMIADWNTQFNNYFNMEPVDESSLKYRVKTGDFAIALYPIVPKGGDPISALSAFKSSESANPAGFRDAAYDAMLDAARAKSGTEAVAAYKAAEKYLGDQGVFYPLYYEKSYYASAKGVTGIVFHPYGPGIDFIQAGKE